MASLCTTVLYDFRNEAYCRLTVVATSGRPQSMPDLYAAHDANFSAFCSRAWVVGCGLSVTTLLSQLESSAEPFGPLKSAIVLQLTIGQDLSKERSEYSELRKKIDKVLKDLSTHMRSPAEGMMTDSVKLICSEIEAEVSALDAKQGLSTGRRLVDAMDGLDEVMECCQRVHDHLERLTLTARIGAQAGQDEALHVSCLQLGRGADIKRGACTEGTREAQIKLLLEWADEPSSGRTCWMNGMAGTGKTTIAYTVCTELKSKNQLGASFFCSRTIPECRRVKHIIPSIALSADIDAHALALNVQYKKLIEDPLAARQPDTRAADACRAHASDPISDIQSAGERDHAQDGWSADGHDDARLVLHNLDSAVVRQDIETYMRKELHDIPLTHAQWRSIVDRCGMLFIYAATTCRYIKQEHEMHNLATAVSVIMNSASVPMEQGDESVIDELYKTILDTAFNRSRASQGNKRRMKMVLETATDRVSTTAAKIPPRDNRGSLPTTHRRCEPKFNICALPSSFLLDDQVKDLAHRVTQSISPGLVYACRYWTTHLTLGEHTSSLIGLSTASSIPAAAMDGNREPHQEHALCDIHHTERREVVYRARRTRTCHKASPRRIPVRIDLCQPSSIQSTPHIYASMLPFWPRSRPLSVAYMPRASGLVQPTGAAIDRRRLALIATWKVSTRSVKSMSLSRDGRRLVAPTADSIEVYDTTTGESVVSLAEERTKDVDYVAISPDGSKVAFSREGGTPYVWDIANGDAVTQLLPDGVSAGWSLAFSPDGSRVACGLDNGEVYICALGPDVSAHGPLTGHITYVNSVVFSSDGLHLASDRTTGLCEFQSAQYTPVPLTRALPRAHLIKLSEWWDLQTGQTVLGPLTGHSNTILCVAFSHNGAFIASGSYNTTIRVYDTRTGHTVLGPLQGHTGSIRSVIFSPDSTRLFSCSYDGTVRIWNVQDIDTSNPLPATSSLSSHILCIRYSRSGTRLVSGSEDGSIHVWDVATGQLVLGPLHGHRHDVISVDYSADDRYIASGSYDMTLRIWDGLTGQDIHGPMEGHWGWVKCMRFSPDSTVVVSGSDDHTVRVWDVSTGQQVTQLLQGRDLILSVGISPDSHRVVCGSKDGKIAVLDRHSGTTLVGPFDAHKELVRSVEFSPDGKRLVSGSDDQSVGIWDAETGKQLVVCGESGGAHSHWFLSVSFSPNGLYVASGSFDRTVRVWDSENGKLIHGPLKAHTDIVPSIQFSPDGSHLVSCSYDRTIRLWDVSFLATHPQGDNMILGTSF
ncbi:WD40 repeat-like protein [Rhizoctonia solani]|uniref:WD40 repeat-like protein n=1 Tax=Rhizoctonia solani TaxID=456999 RepID=A0A8H7I5H3_9AGAM|nr:WD40 repeat-like protein [Rhizoctonia solani]